MNKQPSNPISFIIINQEINSLDVYLPRLLKVGHKIDQLT